MSKIYGFIKISNISYNFVYEDKVLNLEYDYEKINTNNSLPWTYLEGGNIETPNELYFSIDNVEYGFEMKSIYFTSFTLKIKVKYYLIIERPYISERLIISFINQKFNKWLNLLQNHSVKNNGDEIKDESVIDLASTKKNNIFDYKGYKCDVKPSVNYILSSFEYNYQTLLCIEIDGKPNYDYLYDLVLKVKDTLSFIFYRTNVELGKITLMQEVKTNGGKSRCEKFAELIFENYISEKMENSDPIKIFDYGFIPWEVVYCYFSEILNFIEKGQLYLLNLPENKKLKKYISSMSISKDASAFEFEFSKLYSNYSTEKFSECNYQNILKKINSLSFTKGEKEIVDNMTSIYLCSPSLKEKMIHALNEFDSIINLKKLYDTFFSPSSDYIIKIATFFTKGRNTINHGSLSACINNDVANTFFIVKILIFAMQLKRIGMDDAEIWESISCVFEIRDIGNGKFRIS